MRKERGKAGVALTTMFEPDVWLRLMGNPEKTDRRILAWFSISIFLFRCCVGFDLQKHNYNCCNRVEGLYTPVAKTVNSIISLAP